MSFCENTLKKRLNIFVVRMVKIVNNMFLKEKKYFWFILWKNMFILKFALFIIL